MLSSDVRGMLHSLRQLWLQPGDPVSMMIEKVRTDMGTTGEVEYLQLPGWSLFGSHLEMSIGQLIGIAPGVVLFQPRIIQGLDTNYPNKNFMCLVESDSENGMVHYEGVRLAPLYTEFRMGNLVRRCDSFDMCPAIAYWQSGKGTGKKYGEMGFDSNRWVQVVAFLNAWLPE